MALGASNLTRGFHAVVAAARHLWGPDIEVLAALGHGRSYGMPSTILARTLPGILQCGLWRQLDRLPSARTRALITDVGNDILYGASVAQILGWLEESIVRLQRHTPDIVLTDLPLASIGRLSTARFLFFRALLVPRCRLSLPQVREAAEALVQGLAALAHRRQVRFFRLRPEWYGLDPIHIRPGLWSSVWREILCGEATAVPSGTRSLREALQLYFLAPERRRILGVEQVRTQAGVRLRKGGLVWLY